MKIIYNGNVVEENELKISPLSSGFNYGEGFFTTIKVENGVPRHIDLHIKRVKNSIQFFNFNFIIPNLIKNIDIILKENSLKNARIKLTIFRDINRVSYILFCNKLQQNTYKETLTISEYIRGNDEIFKYKSLNYYNNLQNLDTIFIDHKNRLLETGFANIFLIKNGGIYTPPNNLPILPGTYREYLLLLKQIEGYNIIEKDIYKTDIKHCDGFFITNSIRGMVCIKQIENYIIPTDLSKSFLRYIER